MLELMLETIKFGCRIPSAEFTLGSSVPKEGDSSNEYNDVNCTSMQELFIVKIYTSSTVIFSTVSRVPHTPFFFSPFLRHPT